MMTSGQIQEVIYNDENPGIIMRWKVKQGRTVAQNEILCEYKTSRPGKIKSQFAGIVKKILKNENDAVNHGDILVVIEKCSHSTVWKNVCTDCGALVESNAADGSNFLSMMHSVPDLLVSEKKALDLGREDKNFLLEGRKLALIVDLDQTILHTTKDQVPRNLKDVFHFQLPHTCEWHHTKFRPHAERFLTNISKYYELHVFTLGVRTYARSITKLIDPKKKFFQHRILSRDECFHSSLKTLNLKHLFPCGDNMVCIIDDREDVWRSAANLIRVPAYSFFQGCDDINAPPSAVDSKPTQSTETGKKPFVTIEEGKRDAEAIEWKDGDDYLLHLEKILIKIHASFFAQYESLKDSQEDCKLDLKDIVPCEKRKVLRGCNILFSGVVCANEKVEDSWAYRLAVSYGANVQAELIKEDRRCATTHVIGMRDGTEKVVKARKHNIHVVNMDWLLDSTERWEKADESLYPISKEPSQRVIRHCKTKVRTNYVRERKVLGGCNVLFSGVVPLNEKLETSWAYKLAVNHGAKVQKQLIVEGSYKTTHVIGLRDGTEKLKMARCHKIHAVNIDWLLDSIEKSVKADEKLHPISKKPSDKYLKYSTKEKGMSDGEKRTKDVEEILEICRSMVAELDSDSEDDEADDDDFDDKGRDSNNDGGSKKRKHDDDPEDMENLRKRILLELEKM